VKVWDADTGQELLTLRENIWGGVTGVCFSPDAKRLASASLDGTVKVWDADKGQLLLSLKGHKSLVFSVCFRPEGNS
jgi:WD40 repeat protein